MHNSQNRWLHSYPRAGFSTHTQQPPETHTWKTRHMSSVLLPFYHHPDPHHLRHKCSSLACAVTSGLQITDTRARMSPTYTTYVQNNVGQVQKVEQKPGFSIPRMNVLPCTMVMSFFWQILPKAPSALIIVIPSTSQSLAHDRSTISIFEWINEWMRAFFLSSLPIICHLISLCSKPLST